MTGEGDSGFCGACGGPRVALDWYDGYSVGFVLDGGITICSNACKVLCCEYEGTGAGEAVVDFGVKLVAGLGLKVVCCICGCGDRFGLAGDITGRGDI